MRRSFILAAGTIAAVSVVAYLAKRRAAPGEPVAEEDQQQALPGDDIVSGPASTATFAADIDAWPEEIWPWIVQMGAGRGGWYVCDRFLNAGRESATNVLAAYQLPQVGDVVPAGGGETAALRVKALDRNRWILWWDGIGDITWCWSLNPGDSGTRLLSRVRIRRGWRNRRAVLLLRALTARDGWLMQGSLDGIRLRAEGLARQRRESIEATGMLLSQAMQSA